MLSIAWTKLSPELLLTRDGGDPLGFRAYANRLARELCPGLTGATRSTRCFALLTLGLKVANGFDDSVRNERFLRFERLWVVAQVNWFREQARFAGKRRALRILESAGDNNHGVDLTKPILTAQLSTGMWGTYRRTAMLFGLIQAKGRGGPRFAGLTTAGTDLASAVRSVVAPGFQFKTHLDKETMNVQFLASIDPERTGATPDPSEVHLLTKQIRGFDRMHDRALGRLRECFDKQGGQLNLESLTPKELSARQQDALRAALELRRLLGEIEQPYRAWVTSSDSGININPQIWNDDAAWNLARMRGESDIIQLRERVARDPRRSMEQVHRHHEWLAGVRGAAPWRRGDQDPIKASFEMPDFGLSAPAHLFEEGVNANAR